MSCIVGRSIVMSVWSTSNKVDKTVVWHLSQQVSFWGALQKMDQFVKMKTASVSLRVKECKQTEHGLGE